MSSKNMAIKSLRSILQSLESGSRPKGGVSGIRNGIPSIGAEHLTADGGFCFDRIKYIPKEYASRLKRGRIQPGDVLIVKDGATTGKVSYVDQQYPFAESYVNEHVFICRPSQEVCGKYLFYFLRSNSGNSQIMVTFHGAAQGGISSAFVDEVYVPMLTLQDQLGIVNHLDCTLQQVRLTKSRLERIPTILKKFRQSVLSAACSGKLTEDWRAGQHLATHYDIVNSNTTLRDIESEIPKEWSVMAFTDVCQIASNLVNPADYQGHAHIAPDNIEKESGKLLSYNTIADDRVTSPKHLFHSGQIIYSKIRPYLSKAILVDFDGLCSADMYPLTSLINPDYLLHYILSPQFIKLASTAGERSVLPKINQKELSIIPVPVPSVEEQAEIVNRVQRLLKLVESLDSNYNNAMARIEKIEQSTLAKAFRSEIISNGHYDQCGGT